MPDAKGRTSLIISTGHSAHDTDECQKSSAQRKGKIEDANKTFHSYQPKDYFTVNARILHCRSDLATVRCLASRAHQAYRRHVRPVIGPRPDSSRSAEARWAMTRLRAIRCVLSVSLRDRN